MIGPPPSATRVFDTTRSPLGELLYKLKNRGDEAVVPEIVDTAATFVKGWAWRIDAIVPVPPSNTARKSDPAFALRVGRLPVERILAGRGYEITAEDLTTAVSSGN
jgi:hypothetical protein